MVKISDLPKDRKIELIKRIHAGDVPLIIDGKLIENGIVLIEKDGEYFFEGTKVLLEELEKRFTGTVITLPDNGR